MTDICTKKSFDIYIYPTSLNVAYKLIKIRTRTRERRIKIETGTYSTTTKGMKELTTVGNVDKIEEVYKAQITTISQ